MNFALTYLTARFFYRLGDFFHHWYVDGTRSFAHKFISTLENLDKTFAIRITFHYLFQPLYKDYTVVGRLLGFIFRSGRILIGGVIYMFVAAIFLAMYGIWLLIPAAILIYAARNF
ncbi:MAG: hypothetical protein KGJ89_01145 [Patescibacteria group bacterium]|nr:hypothetical protein [Patescibacteria group bacterium]MDE2015118.1 hypothetical protein [Patescibacteria group bacterium]MDE2226546.1 hypothetical protein [Patescibacteria group bacterium]